MPVASDEQRVARPIVRSRPLSLATRNSYLVAFSASFETDSPNPTFMFRTSYLYLRTYSKVLRIHTNHPDPLRPSFRLPV